MFLYLPEQFCEIINTNDLSPKSPPSPFLLSLSIHHLFIFDYISLIPRFQPTVFFSLTSDLISSFLSQTLLSFLLFCSVIASSPLTHFLCS